MLEGKVGMMPCSFATTEDMIIAFESEVSGEGGEDGGPKRGFKAASKVTRATSDLS
jgi:hypothetical protein